MKEELSRSHRNLGPICAIPDAARTTRPSKRKRGGEPDSYHAIGGIKSDRETLSPEILYKLARLIEEPLIDSSAGGGMLNVPNPHFKHPGVPAGYTYLFQLAAHDLVNTLVPIGSDTALPMGFRNLRRKPLALETVFGNGSLACPFAYDKASKQAALRTGFVRESSGHQRVPPARDLPRASFNSKGEYDSKSRLDTVLIPDSRNDDNPLVAQMTVLFHGVYNYFITQLSVNGGNTPQLDADAIEETAQYLLQRIYRRIVREDLLRRILHPGIYHLYATKGPIDLDCAIGNRSASIEFAFAAGRLGHAMVRKTYALNKHDPEHEMTDLQGISSRHTPASLPLQKNYLLDWDFFFQPEAGPPSEHFNWATRFGPHVVDALKLKDAAQTPNPGKIGEPTINGTTFRDLIRESSWPLVTVSQLVNHAITHSPAEGWGTALDAVIAVAEQAKIVDAGLKALEAQIQFDKHPYLSVDERRAVVQCPPLSLFFQFEAQQLGNNGATLGPLGSITVAEAMWPVFAPEPWEQPASALSGLEVSFLGKMPSTMPELIGALKPRAQHIFAT